MPGTLVTFGTRHAWNAFRWGLGMPGTFKNFKNRILRTSYILGPIRLDQNIHFLWRIIWANQIGPKVYEVRRIRVLKFSNVPGISSLHYDQCSLHSPPWYSMKWILIQFGRIQTLLRESVKFLTFRKILWSRDSLLKVGPLLKIWAPLAQRTLIYWPKMSANFPEGKVPLENEKLKNG